MTKITNIDKALLETYSSIFDTQAQTKVLDAVSKLDLTIEEKLNYIEDNYSGYVHVQVKDFMSDTTIFIGMLDEAKEAVLEHLRNTKAPTYITLWIWSLEELCTRFGLTLQYL